MKIRRPAGALACAIVILVSSAAACSRAPTSAPDTPDASVMSAQSVGVAPAPVVGSPDGVADASSRPPSGPLEATAPAGRPEAGPRPTALVKLLDAGRPPHRPLRYAWQIGQRERLTMDLRTSASTEADGVVTPEVVLPPVRIVVAIDPRSVSADGDLTYAWHVTTTEVPVADRSPLADGMRAEVAAVDHLAGTGIVTALGLSTSVSLDPESLVDAAAGTTGQMVEQVRQTLRDLAAPFPIESVGRGARWEKLSQLASKDARITQTDTFTLVDAARTGGALDDVLAQTAPAQPLRTPGAPDSQARMESMLASGDAKVRFDLSRLVPDSRFDGTTTMVVSGPAAAGTRRRTMIMRVDIVLSGAIAAGRLP